MPTLVLSAALNKAYESFIAASIRGALFNIR